MREPRPTRRGSESPPKSTPCDWPNTRWTTTATGIAIGADLTDANLAHADLTDADLAHADLTDADLADADLTDADLADANLAGANLAGADLTDANLAHADLTDADLAHADLAHADLTDADLTDANLADADLTDADLADAYLADADLAGANLAGANLAGARNLTAGQLESALNIPPEDIPIVPTIDAAIEGAINAGGTLDMGNWHGVEGCCGTTHCRAGWAVHLAGKDGKVLEDKIGTQMAGTLIYHASRHGQPVPHFFAGDEDAWADIQKCAAEQRAEAGA